MEEQNYSKRELDEHFKDVKMGVEQVNKGVESLNTKVAIQNGRVTKSETWVKGLAMVGTSSLFLLGIIMSLVVYSFKLSQENLKATILLEVKNLTTEDISKAVVEAIDKYNISIEQ